MMDSEPLIPDRTCGECTVCCVVLAIDHEEIQKDAGIRCPHANKCCRIYARRPTPCREFVCAWRAIPGLDDDWRPDRSGVLLYPDSCEVGGKTVPALTIHLLHDPETTLANPSLLAFVAHQVREDRRLYLGRLGYPGFRHLRAQLNSPQMLAAAHRGTAEVRAILEQAWTFLSNQPHPQHTLSHRGNHVRSADEVRTSPSDGISAG